MRYLFARDDCSQSPSGKIRKRWFRAKLGFICSTQLAAHVYFWQKFILPLYPSIFSKAIFWSLFSWFVVFFLSYSVWIFLSFSSFPNPVSVGGLKHKCEYLVFACLRWIIGRSVALFCSVFNPQFIISLWLSRCRYALNFFLKRRQNWGTYRKSNRDL